MGKRGQRRKLLDAATASAPSFHVSDPRALSLFAPPRGGKVQITEQNALTLSTVWAAVRVITSAVCILPLHIHREAKGKERVFGTPGAKLAKKPCPEMGKSTFWEVLQQHALIAGNGYAEIERNNLGEPIALWPLAPRQTRPVRNKSTLQLEYETYGIIDGAAFRSTIPARDMFHLKGLGYDGLIGYSVIELASRTLDIAASAEVAQSSLFDAGLRPGGWVEYPGTLQDFQKSNIEEKLKAKSGATAFGKALMLWGGAKFHQLDLSLTDAEFIRSREFQVEEVARWFNIPPHKIHHLLRATFSNIEHQSQEFVTDSLLYWLEKVSDEFQDKILEDGSDHYARHVVEKLLRGDTITRYTAYGMGRQWGFLSPNEIREREDMPPMEGGDVFHVPVNMAPVSMIDMIPAVSLQIVSRDCAELFAMQDDPDLYQVWVDRATPADFGWVAHLAQSAGVMCRTRCVEFAKAYGQLRLSSLRSGSDNISIHEVTALLRDFLSKGSQ